MSFLGAHPRIQKFRVQLEPSDCDLQLESGIYEDLALALQLNFVASRLQITSDLGIWGTWILRFESANQGQSFSQFMAMWGNMTLDDVYGAEQADRCLISG